MLINRVNDLKLIVMKRLITTLTLVITTLIPLHAQEITNGNTIIFGNEGQNRITYNSIGLNVKLAGMFFQFNSNDKTPQPQQYKSISPFGFAEVGISTMANAKYALYTPEEAAMMRLNNTKSRYMSINLYSNSIQLNHSGTLTMDSGITLVQENYRFKGPYSMRYQDRMMRPIELNKSVTISELLLAYITFPMMLTWNFQQKYYVSCGLSLDVLLLHSLMYQKPKVINRVEPVTIEPIQFSGILHVGTNKIYGFVNYGLAEMFTYNTGPTAHRFSAGIGFYL